MPKIKLETTTDQFDELHRAAERTRGKTVKVDRELSMSTAKHTPGRGILIQPTAYGQFFVHDGRRVWDGEEWRGFGEAERYKTYGEALKARRAAIAKATGANKKGGAK